MPASRYRTIEEEDLEAELERHREWLESEGASGARADFSWTDLTNLREGHFYRADLRGANLRGALLDGVWLGEADLRAASFGGDEGATRTDLRKAKLGGAHLSGARLEGANLRKANLRDGHFNGASFKGANLYKARLGEANLRKTDFTGANLDGAWLQKADLTGADLTGANLKEAKLHEAKLYEADLSGVDLTWTRLDEAVVDEDMLRRTKKPKKGGRIGLNGLWAENSDSAALNKADPPGDSMQGGNADAVVESLKHARRLHAFSLALVVLTPAIIHLDFEEVSPTSLIGLLVSIGEYAGDLTLPVAMGLSAVLLSLVGSFMSDALSGARYLQTRRGAQTVGTFPWALSRYGNRRLRVQTEFRITRKESRARAWLYWARGKALRLQSVLVRFAMAFHPLAYVFFWDWSGSLPWYYWAAGLLPLVFSLRIFLISRQFQKPFVFDRLTEKKRESDLEKLTAVAKRVDKKLGTPAGKRSRPDERSAE